jgi:hypothetical protein
MATRVRGQTRRLDSPKNTLIQRAIPGINGVDPLKTPFIPLDSLKSFSGEALKHVDKYLSKP